MGFRLPVCIFGVSEMGFRPPICIFGASEMGFRPPVCIFGASEMGFRPLICISDTWKCVSRSAKGKYPNKKKSAEFVKDSVALF
jgi:hypothetical protein